MQNGIYAFEIRRYLQNRMASPQSDYDQALYQEPGMCPDGACLLRFPDGTEKAADMALFSAVGWTDRAAEYATGCPEIPQIECEKEDDPQSVLPQELAESQVPEEQSCIVRSEQFGQGPWVLAAAPWQLVQVSVASQAREGGKPPRKKPAAATRTAPGPGNAAGKPPRKEPAPASLTMHKLALTPDLLSKLQEYVDGRIAKLQDKPGQFRMVKNGKLIATKQINKNIPPGSLLCIYDASDASDHRVAGDRQFTKTTGANADARLFCMCVRHFHAACKDVTTAGPAGAKQ